MARQQATTVPAPRRFLTPRAVGALAVLLVVLLLSLVAAGEARVFGDLALARYVQQTESPLGDALAAVGNWLGGTLGATLVGLILGAVLLWHRAWWDATFLMACEGARAANHVLKSVIDSPRPTAQEVQILEVADGFGFPSGHAQTAMLIGGAVLVIANRRIDRPPVRLAVSGLVITAILVVGYARVYSGVHWPSDVIGGYLWGFVLLVTVIVSFCPC